MTKEEILRANAKNKNVIPTKILSYPVIINTQDIGKGKTTTSTFTGSGGIIDCGNRITGSEVFDCGLRI